MANGRSWAASPPVIFWRGSCSAIPRPFSPPCTRSTTTPDWYARVASQQTFALALLGYVVGTVMAIGALFGCLNTMYSAVSTRGREIATLRALGYGALPVAVSV